MIEHRFIPSLGREESDLASGEGEGRSSQFSGSSPEEEREMESQAVAETEGWLSYEVPGPAVSLAETRQYLVLCNNRDNVFYSRLESSRLSWRRTSYPASEVRSSQCGG